MLLYRRARAFTNTNFREIDFTEKRNVIIIIIHNPTPLPHSHQPASPDPSHMCLCYLLLEKEKKNNIHTDALGVFANYLKLQKTKIINKTQVLPL